MAEETAGEGEAEAPPPAGGDEAVAGESAPLWKRALQVGLSLALGVGLLAVTFNDPALDLDALKAAEVEVVVTWLSKLRDSNPLYSALWRTFIAVFGNSEDGTRLPNPFGEGRVSLRSWLRLMNFKANHRKVIIADDAREPGGWVGLVTSANPHDGSSAHGNIAVRFTGEAVRDLLESERAVLEFSAGGMQALPEIQIEADGAGLGVSVITESRIKDALLAGIRRTGKGDKLIMSVFYLSDRDVVNSLNEARKRGADMRVLLDPNFDAFGRKKNGVPNRQTGYELMKAKVKVRWCATNGEQCHAKVVLIDYKDGRSRLVAGSANFTRRNLENFNLETSVLVEGLSEASVFSETRDWFNLLWNNQYERTYTVDFEKYADDSLGKVLLYRWMEFSGMSTF